MYNRRLSKLRCLKRAYCAHCDDDVKFTTMLVSKSTTIKGITFDYSHIKATCSVCGTEVYPTNIDQDNERAKYMMYNKINLQFEDTSVSIKLEREEGNTK